MWTVSYLPEAEAERNALPAAERVAIQHAVEKLQALGPRLSFPHSADARTLPGTAAEGGQVPMAAVVHASGAGVRDRGDSTGWGDRPARVRESVRGGKTAELAGTDRQEDGSDGN